MVDVESICRKARKASYTLASFTNEEKNRMLTVMADAIVNGQEQILAANSEDISALDAGNKVFLDRLTLTYDRLEIMAEGLRQLIALPDPVGEITDRWTLKNGIEISKVRAPLGVIGVIYEARPNVTADVAGLCVKSGNAVVLRGGKEAISSNRAIYNVMYDALIAEGFDADCIGFIDDIDRAASLELLKCDKYVDVIIPRGGDGLKKFVLSNAAMPVIASAGGNCHTYIEKSADIDMASAILYNAKMSRPTVCNSCEQLLIDREILPELDKVLRPLYQAGCKLIGDEDAVKACEYVSLCDESAYYDEHLDYVLSVKTIDGYRQAVDWINEHGTKHSECIVTRSDEAAEYFQRGVDAGCVYVNASTRFTDGFEFGFGAEIAVSTQKLHARGPLGLRQLTCEKYLAVGNGQIR